MLIVLRLVAACGEAEHAHLSSLKMVRAEISTEEVLLLLLRSQDILYIFMRVQLPGQRHFKCHALPPFTLVSLSLWLSLSYHFLLLCSAHYGLKNVKHVDSTVPACECFVPALARPKRSHFKLVASPESATAAAT